MLKRQLVTHSLPPRLTGRTASEADACTSEDDKRLEREQHPAGKKAIKGMQTQSAAVPV